MPDTVMIEITILHEDGKRTIYYGQASEFTISQTNNVQPIYLAGQLVHYVPGTREKSFSIKGNVIGQEHWHTIQHEKYQPEPLMRSRFDLIEEDE